MRSDGGGVVGSSSSSSSSSSMMALLFTSYLSPMNIPLSLLEETEDELILWLIMISL